MKRILKYLLTPLKDWINKDVLRYIPNVRELSCSQDDLRNMGMVIGQNTSFYVEFWMYSEPYLIEVGSNTQITAGVKAFTHGGGQVARESYPRFDTFGRVKVGDWCYIGNNALIMPGVTIGDNCLIAAGSVVTKSVPKGKVVGGNPAVILGSVEDYIQRNLNYNVDTKDFSFEEKAKYILSHQDRLKTVSTL